MPSLQEILGLGAGLTEMAGQTIAPALMDVYEQQVNARNTNSQAMLATGLGILAGNKGNYGAAMPAIGAGMAAGEDTYQNAVKLQQTDAMKRMQLQANILKARELANYRRAHLDELRQTREEATSQRGQAAQWRHEDTLTAIEQRRDAALERAQTATDAAEQRRWYEQAQIEEKKLQREQQMRIAEMHSEDLAAGRDLRADLMSNKPAQVRVNAKGEQIERDPVTGNWTPSLTPEGKPVMANVKPGPDDMDLMRRAYHQYVLDLAPGEVKIPFEDWSSSQAGRDKLQEIRKAKGEITPGMFKSGEGFGNIQITRGTVQQAGMPSE